MASGRHDVLRSGRGREADHPSDDPGGKADTARSPKASKAPYAGAVIGGEYADGDIRGAVFIAGKRGSGKSFLKLFRLSLCKARVLIFDTIGQYSKSDDSNIRKMLRGYVTIHSPGALRECLAQHVHPRGCFRILYVPLSGDLQEHFEAVTKIALKYGELGPGLLYAIDELDMFCENGKLKVPQREPGGPPRRPALQDAIEYGRHRKMAMVATSRCAAQVARSFTRQCSEICVFRTTEPDDIVYFQKYLGSIARKLPSLGEYFYVRWLDDTSEPQVCGGKIRI